ncbi:MAG: hypothetical protein JO362_07500 [Streptomycetaceae bacterium]|nr:hypothetical protein [Streptomycetaceae bacterium]
MKTTMLMRPIANPRRTTLAHVTDASPEAAELQTAPLLASVPQQPQPQERPLPRQTANPRRTVLTELPAAVSVTPLQSNLSSSATGTVA